MKKLLFLFAFLFSAIALSSQCSNLLKLKVIGNDSLFIPYEGISFITASPTVVVFGTNGGDNYVVSGMTLDDILAQEGHCFYDVTTVKYGRVGLATNNVDKIVEGSDGTMYLITKNSPRKRFELTDDFDELQTQVDTAAMVFEADLEDLGGTITLNADTNVYGNAWVLDEDDFASDDSTKVSSQQATKAYIATQTDSTKLADIEALADVTDETNVVASLDGATIASATVATGDKVVIQDVDDADNVKTVTAQSIANLAAGGPAFPSILASEISSGGTLTLDNLYPINTTGGDFTSIVPAGAVYGDTFGIFDNQNNFASDNFYVDFASNYSNYEGQSAGTTIIDANNDMRIWMFVGENYGWVEIFNN